MKGRRHSPEQVVRKLREADRLLAEGADVDGVCRQLEVSVQTYQRWRVQFKAMRPEDVVRLKALEKENSRLKRLLAEKSSTTTCSGRWLGETGEPGAAAQGSGAPARPFPGL
jgi:putative transposase